MTTKQQEREALAKILKIVEGLGSDSYIKSAFDGVFEIAAENIDNDFGINALDRGRHQGREEAKETIEGLQKQLKDLNSKLELSNKAAEYNNEVADFNYDRCQEYKVEVDSLKIENESLTLETTKLKAKLYDLLYK